MTTLPSIEKLESAKKKKSKVIFCTVLVIVALFGLFYCWGEGYFEHYDLPEDLQNRTFVEVDYNKLDGSYMRLASHLEPAICTRKSDYDFFFQDDREKHSAQNLKINTFKTRMHIYSSPWFFNDIKDRHIVDIVDPELGVYDWSIDDQRRLLMDATHAQKLPVRHNVLPAELDGQQFYELIKWDDRLWFGGEKRIFEFDSKNIKIYNTYGLAHVDTVDNGWDLYVKPDRSLSTSKLSYAEHGGVLTAELYKEIHLHRVRHTDTASIYSLDYKWRYKDTPPTPRHYMVNTQLIDSYRESEGADVLQSGVEGVGIFTWIVSQQSYLPKELCPSEATIDSLTVASVGDYLKSSKGIESISVPVQSEAIPNIADSTKRDSLIVYRRDLNGWIMPRYDGKPYGFNYYIYVFSLRADGRPYVWLYLPIGLQYRMTLDRVERTPANSLMFHITDKRKARAKQYRCEYKLYVKDAKADWYLEQVEELQKNGRWEVFDIDFPKQFTLVANCDFPFLSEYAVD